MASIPSYMIKTLLPSGDIEVVSQKAHVPLNPFLAKSEIVTYSTKLGQIKVIQRFDSEGVLNGSFILEHPHSKGFKFMRSLAYKMAKRADFVNLVSEDCIHFQIF